jgi:multidrug resistance efflux pump
MSSNEELETIIDEKRAIESSKRKHRDTIDEILEDQKSVLRGKQLAVDRAQKLVDQTAFSRKQIDIAYGFAISETQDAEMILEQKKFREELRESIKKSRESIKKSVSLKSPPNSVKSK